MYSFKAPRTGNLALIFLPLLILLIAALLFAPPTASAAPSDEKIAEVRAAVAGIDAAAAEREKIMKTVDEWADYELPALLYTHFANADKSLLDARFPDDSTYEETLRSCWEHVRAGRPDDVELTEIWEGFIIGAAKNADQAMKDIKRKIPDSFAKHMKTAVLEAGEAIRKPFTDEINRLDTPLPPFPEIEPIAVDDSTLEKILERKIVKLLESALPATLSNVVRWTLAGIDEWDGSTARASLEKNLREILMAEYRAAISSTELWSAPDGLRASLEKILTEKLTESEKANRQIAERYLDTVTAWASPAGRAYMDASTGKSGDTWFDRGNVFVQLQEAFGDLVETVSVEKLLEIYESAPSKEDLAKLAKGLGEQFAALYDVHGFALLKIADTFGADNLIASQSRLHDETIWALSELPADVYRGIKGNAKAFSGLLTLIENGVDAKGTRFSEASLTGIEERPETARAVIEKFRDDPETIERAFASASAIADVEAALQAGADGLDLWYAHTKSGAKDADANARSAINLLRKGYPAEHLRDADGLRWAEKCDGLPGGRALFGMTAGMSGTGRTLFFIVVIAIIAGLGVLLYKRTRKTPDAPEE